MAHQIIDVMVLIDLCKSVAKIFFFFFYLLLTSFLIPKKINKE